MATCSICLDQIKKDQPVKCTPCMHPFHTECIDPWLKENADKPAIMCPTCKNDISVLVERKNVQRPIFSHFGMRIMGINHNNNYMQFNPFLNAMRIENPSDNEYDNEIRPPQNNAYISISRRRSSSIEKKKVKYRKKSLDRSCKRLNRLRY